MTLYDDAASEFSTVGPKGRLITLLDSLTPKKRSEVEDLMLREPRLQHAIVARVLTRHFPDHGPFKGDMVATWRTTNDG